MFEKACVERGFECFKNILLQTANMEHQKRKEENLTSMIHETIILEVWY